MYWEWDYGRAVVTATQVPVAPLPLLAAEPVTLAEGRRHLQNAPVDDADLERWIRTARYTVEQRTGYALVPQTWDLWLDVDSEYIYPGWIALPLTPVTAITEVATVDAVGAETIVASSGYWVNAAARLPALVFSSALAASHGVRVRYTAGLADKTTIPPDLLTAIFWLIAHQFVHRGDVETVGDEPAGVTRILERYVLPTVA